MLWCGGAFSMRKREAKGKSETQALSPGSCSSLLLEMQSRDSPSPARSGSACHPYTRALCVHVETDIYGVNCVPLEKS